VHGGLAWIWRRHFLPAFARAGYRSHALFLRGHGRSEGRELIRTFVLADYVADLRVALARIDRPLVVVGFSLGGAVLQDFLRAGGEVEGAVLMSSVPPFGLAWGAWFLAMRDPILWHQLALLTTAGLASVDLQQLRRGMFSERLSDEVFSEFLSRAGDESPLVGIELDVYLADLWGVVTQIGATHCPPSCSR
jgi:pimeloyl-ACP methyl ester carboxylesterase